MLNVNRILWLDIAKGIAIILMIIGHSSLPKSISNFIWAFHMPLFFIASGWTTNFCKYNFGGFIKQKSKTLLIPFTIYSIIILIIQCCEEINDPMFFLSNGWVSYALWFIPVLYLGLLCAKAIFSIKSISFRYFALISVFVIGIGLSSYNIHLPWSLSSVLYATVFIVLGSEIRRFLSQYIQPKWYNIILLFVVTLLISHFWRLDMCFNSILPVIPITIGAISGTLMVFMISMLVEKHFKLLTKILVSIGRETYIIVAFSQIIIMSVNQYLTHNIFVKYGLLILILIIIKYFKDAVNCFCKTKLL